MVFSSVIFLCFFLPFFLVIYHLVPKTNKNNVALFASLFFYAWGAPDFLLLALGSIFIDFFLVKAIHKGSFIPKSMLLFGSIALNVGLLLYFKYANFFVDNTNQILTALTWQTIEWENIVLPIGISFYTFQKLSYSIDVYRGVKAPLKKLSDYALFIMLFPQLIAGPIVRFNEIAEQITGRVTNDFNDRIYGIYRFSIGLGKKVLIANILGEKADLIFGMEMTAMNSSLAWFGIICYTFQIYFDFSGYSDMAIGLGRIMGFKFPENFNSPYISQNITEFWRRWHITLGSWMRDYLYIPLGGNKVKSKYRLYINLWLVFLISGFWHGAAWNFILWGAFHGLFLIADRLFLNKLTAFIGIFGRVLLTFVVVITGWVLFRSESLNQALVYTKTLYSFDFKSIELYWNKEVGTTLLAAFLLSFLLIIKPINTAYHQFSEGVSVSNAIQKGLISGLLMLFSLAAIVGSSFNPFIYFRF